LNARLDVRITARSAAEMTRNIEASLVKLRPRRPFDSK
jgi:hypothetical protein